MAASMPRKFSRRQAFVAGHCCRTSRRSFTSNPYSRRQLVDSRPIFPYPTIARFILTFASQKPANQIRVNINRFGKLVSWQPALRPCAPRECFRDQRATACPNSGSNTGTSVVNDTTVVCKSVDALKAYRGKPQNLFHSHATADRGSERFTDRARIAHQPNQHFGFARGRQSRCARGLPRSFRCSPCTARTDHLSEAARGESLRARRAKLRWPSRPAPDRPSAPSCHAQQFRIAARLSTPAPACFRWARH